MRLIGLILLAALALMLCVTRVPAVKRVVRGWLHRLMCFALRRRSLPCLLPFAGESPILVVAPHQDDDTLGCGGLILRLRLEGRSVHVVYLTDGSASHPNHPILTSEDLILLRQSEARAALNYLGLDSAEVTFLCARDGTLDRLSSTESTALVERLTELLRRWKPGVILLPCARDGSSEHEAGFKLVNAAVLHAAQSPRLFEYPIWARWNPQLLLRALLKCRHVWRLEFSGYEGIKREALAQYRSQMEPTPPWTKPVLPVDFVSYFTSSEEFFFET